MTNTARMIKEVRGHFHCITKVRQHSEDYGILGIRAVLTETLDTRWAEALRIAARHPVVSGPKPSELFWFTALEFFTKQIQKTASTSKLAPETRYYLGNQEVIFRAAMVYASRRGRCHRTILTRLITINPHIYVSRPKDRYPFECEIYYVGFDSIVGLRRHYEDRHTSSTTHCSNCGANYAHDDYHRRR